ncbi:MarR family winged helix-turn-helix transcriptional regulator [Lacticaseibacillus sp. N501-2]|uniref:MarR family winged helix-turn-helix transcriptional regulator n=1 Tax=Lacticaseibacillus salsurae TaxID=3367729 RepID=UPI0038B3784A
MDALRQIGVIARALDSISNIEFREVDLTRGQYLYLVRIVETPGIIQAQLGDQLKVDRATVARSVAKLCRQGLVEKHPDPHNAKRQRLYATAAGQKAYDPIRRENAYSLAMATKHLTTEQIATLTQLLATMVENVDHDWQFVKNGGKRQY